MLFDYILQLFQSRSPWPGINSDPTVFVLEPIISIGGVLPGDVVDFPKYFHLGKAACEILHLDNHIILSIEIDVC